MKVSSTRKLEYLPDNPPSALTDSGFDLNGPVPLGSRVVSRSLASRGLRRRLNVAKLCHHRELVIIDAAGYDLAIVVKTHELAERNVDLPSGRGERSESAVVDASRLELSDHGVARVEVTWVGKLGVGKRSYPAPHELFEAVASCEGDTTSSILIHETLGHLAQHPVEVTPVEGLVNSAPDG